VTTVQRHPRPVEIIDLRLTARAVDAVHGGPANSLVVEVFPINADRWVALVPRPEGVFKTEADRPDDVEAEVRRAVADVMGVRRVDLTLVDEDGYPWTPRSAVAQAARLGVPLPEAPNREP